MNQTYQNLDVLEFYKKLPFNIYSDSSVAIKNIKSNNPIQLYPPLSNTVFNDYNYNILELGCGTGWFSNSLSYHFNKINVIGVDFNQSAIDFGNNIQKKLKLKTQFIKEDLFKVNFKKKFNLIISLGVLHHTNNCLKGIEKIIELSPEYFFIGLYHKYGRKPFLNHFENLKTKNKSLNEIELENILYEEYKKLDQRKADETHLRSWFKDQILHPKETQHTLAEIHPIIKAKYKIISTSLNYFEKINNLEEIIKNENKWFEIGLEKLRKSMYFPGLFIIMCKKI